MAAGAWQAVRRVVVYVVLCAALTTTLGAAEAVEAPAVAAAGASDVSQLIDEAIAEGWRTRGIRSSGLCDDRAFVRRVYLDLAGRIPTVEETAAFVADAAADKRARLVDELLASEEHARHMAEVFDVVLMGRNGSGERRERRGRRGGGGGDSRTWRGYLQRAFAANRRWDAMVRDILVARPSGDEDEGAQWFLFARRDNHQDMAEAFARTAFGMQIDCAQCHDHPLAFEIEQKHYWGLVAAFRRSAPVQTRQGPAVSESAIGGFVSFSDLSGNSYDAAPTFVGAEELAEVRPSQDAEEEDSPEKYLVPPMGENERVAAAAVPKYSRREAFYERIVSDHPALARAMVNRFWALLMGRGLVHPVDRMDSAHPASHPELLDRLAEEVRRSGYDVKRLVRGIVLSRVYQLDSRPADDAALPESFAYAIERPLTAEAYCRSVLVATGHDWQAGDAELLGLFRARFPDVFPEENVSSLQQAMFLTNNEELAKLFEPEPGTTVERLASIEPPEERVRQAFLTVFGREPEGEEMSGCVEYLSRHDDRARGASQLVWALVTSAEFRFNH